MAILLNDKPKLPRVITSFSEEGYKQYGREFIETWKKHAPPAIGLTVYYEGENFEFTEGISWHPIEEIEFLADFMANLRFPVMHGIIGSEYDVWFDARHARKVFMQAYATRKYGGKVFWLDSDTVLHSDVPQTFFDLMLPDDKFSCYLGRDGWYFTESGFLGFNMNHALAKKFIKNYVQMFVVGTFLANAVHGRLCWNDCGGYDAIRHLCGNGDEFVNLAKNLPQNTMHVFVNSELGRYMDHRKGARKNSRSDASDLVIARTEPYWQTQQGNTPAI